MVGRKYSDAWIWMQSSNGSPDNIIRCIERGVERFKELNGVEPDTISLHKKALDAPQILAIIKDYGMTRVEPKEPYINWVKVGKTHLDKGEDTVEEIEDGEFEDGEFEEAADTGAVKETPIISSNVSNAMYEDGILYIKFHRDCPDDCGNECQGPTYMYFGVEEKVYNKLVAAPSVGSFVNSEIVGKYEYEKLKFDD